MPLIRRATATDIEDVFELTRRFAMTFRPEFDAFRRAFDHLIAQEDTVLLVIEEPGGLLGYLLGFDHYALASNGRIAWIEEIMVRQDRRREGLGRELMRQFEQWAATRGSKLVALATRRARAFYLSLGYEESAGYFRKLL